MEWGGVNEKNTKAGLKASGKGGGLRCPKKAELYIFKKRQRGNKSMNVIKVKFCCIML